MGRYLWPSIGKKVEARPPSPNLRPDFYLLIYFNFHRAAQKKNEE